MTPELTIIQHMRHLAEALAVPVFLVDRSGTLLFYNQPAEEILGKQFTETGELQASVWSRLSVPTDEGGTPLLPEQLPLMETLENERPAMGRFWIKGLDNRTRHIVVSAIPLTSRSGVFLGAAAMFWEDR